ncbi:MAG: Zn-ribbon domain-containing OB-fold protein [Planctomycetota bacterium]
MAVPPPSPPGPSTPEDAGTVVYNLPFPGDLAALESLSPLIVKFPYHIDYIHSYGQDSPFFAGLTAKKLLGTCCRECGKKFATPRKSCLDCGSECDWIELPLEGRIHSFTVCHFGSEAFLKETPFILGLIEFAGVDSLFLTRLQGFDAAQPTLAWIGKKVKAKFKRLAEIKPTDVYFIPA